MPETLREKLETENPAGVKNAMRIIVNHVDALSARLQKIEAAFPCVNAVELEPPTEAEVRQAHAWCRCCPEPDLTAEPMGQDLKDAAEGVDAEVPCE